jgi:hypothetical protein
LLREERAQHRRRGRAALPVSAHLQSCKTAQKKCIRAGYLVSSDPAKNNKTVMAAQSGGRRRKFKPLKWEGCSPDFDARGLSAAGPRT